MKRVAYYRWKLSNPDMPHQGRFLTRHRLPEAEAKAMDPTAEPWGEPDWRDIPETDAERTPLHSTRHFIK